MNLRIKKSIRKRIITLELDTVNFTRDENKMLDELGEPVINFEKVYGTNAVQISKKIRTGFKVRIKFDGSEDIEQTTALCGDFIDELKAVLIDTMATLQADYESMNDIKEEITVENISDIRYSPEYIEITQGFVRCPAIRK
jgi:hypothetical protein